MRIKGIYAFKYLILPEPLCEQIIDQFISMACYDTSFGIKKCLLYVLAHIGSTIKSTVFNFLVFCGFHLPSVEAEGIATEARFSLLLLTQRAKPDFDDPGIIDTLIQATQHLDARVRLAAVWALSHHNLINDKDNKVFTALYRLVTPSEPASEVREAAQQALKNLGSTLVLQMVTDAASRESILSIPLFAPSQTNPLSFGL